MWNEKTIDWGATWGSDQTVLSWTKMKAALLESKNGVGDGGGLALFRTANCYDSCLTALERCQINVSAWLCDVHGFLHASNAVQNIVCASQALMAEPLILRAEGEDGGVCLVDWRKSKTYSMLGSLGGGWGGVTLANAHSPDTALRMPQIRVHPTLARVIDSIDAPAVSPPPDAREVWFAKQKSHIDDVINATSRLIDWGCGRRVEFATTGGPGGLAQQPETWVEQAHGLNSLR